MKKYVRLSDNVVVEVIETDIPLEDLYHSEFVSELKEVSTDLEIDQWYIYKDGEFTKPQWL